MNRDIYYNYIDEQLHILAHRITTNGKLNMLRLHLHSENFYLHFFNLLYGSNLINLNDVSQNVEAIDLIDHDNKIMIQVSSTSTKQKIESALSKDTLKGYVGYRFKFISIAKDATSLRDKTYKNPHSITFDPKEDIYDIRSFLNTVSSLNIDNLKDVYEFIQKELGEKSKNKFDSSILKEKYLNDFKTISLLSNIPKSIDDIFVNLAIIKEKKEEKDKTKLINREAFLSSDEEIHKPKEPIEIKELINKSNKSLIYGKAGIGKTTLCKHIAYKWAKAELYSEFEYLIYIPLREWKSGGIKGAIRDYYYSHDIKNITIDFDSNKTLFLFDGYDELDADRKKLLKDEIEKYTLGHYIITTRPYGYQKHEFEVDEYFETIGFTDENVTEYIDNFFGKDSEKAKDLKSYLQNNISIKQIGYIPLMLEMICSMWKQKSFGFDMTMTELYTQFIENIFFEYTEKNGTAYIQDQEEEIFNYLGKIAFEGLTQQTIVLDKKIIKEKRTFFSDYVLKAGFLNDGKAEKSNPLLNSYQFPHLTFQEYFSALYVSKLESQEQSEIIRDWKFYPHMQMFFAFLGGLIEDKDFLLGEIESEPRDLVGVYKLFLISRIVSYMNPKVFSQFRIENINKLIFHILEWLSHCKDEEGFDEEVFKVLCSINHFIDEIFMDRLINKIKDENYKIDIVEIFHFFNTNEICEGVPNITRELFNDDDRNKINDRDIGILISFIEKKNISMNKKILIIDELNSLNKHDKKVINLFVDFIQNGDICYTKARAYIAKKIAFIGRDDDIFVDILINFIQNETVDAWYRRTAVKALFLIKRNDDCFFKKIVDIFENKNIHAQVSTEISKRYSILDKSNNEGIDRLIYIIQDKRVEDFYKRRTVEVLANLTFKKYDILTTNILKLFPKEFTKESSIRSFFYAFDNNYINLDMLIQNAFHNTKPLYLKNNKLHTIENGKERSTQREVDEATLNEIKMLLKGDGLDD